MSKPDAVGHDMMRMHSRHANPYAAESHSRIPDAVEQAPYFDAIANALPQAGQILITGPGLEKMAFVKHVLRHKHQLAKKIVGVETVNHPDDPQLQTLARKHFLKADFLL
ncbi:hypothetical protein CAter10_2478 [Collimonas arenae]|nr:hypothetical protein CAter10_2478 [Collimonas arenae]